MNKNYISIKNREEASCSLTDNCEDYRELFGCYQLIDSLVQDILLLEEEMVRWRQALIKHLAPLDAQNLHADIFDNLARRNFDNKAYQAYLKAYGYKEDPMEAKEHTEMLWRLRNGTDETSVNL